MTDEITEIVGMLLEEEEITDHPRGEARARTFLDDLASHGYEIVPGWSDNLSKAPRDGTPVLFYAPEYIPPFMVVNCFGETEEHFSASINAETVYGATHWKPITTLNEANADG